MKSYNFIFVFILMFCCTLIYTANSNLSYANSNTIQITIDGNYINTDVNPVLVDGRVLVPLRTISENLGANVQWDKSTQTITLDFSEMGSIVKMRINSKNFYIDGYLGTMDVAPKIINGRTMVPIRFLSENLGFKVDWDAESKTVNIFSEYEFSGDIEEASTLLKLSIANKYTSEVSIDFEDVKELNGESYYLFKVYEDYTDRTVTLGWYYVTMNMDAIYEWDISTDKLIKIL